jgi:hypothetical protein
MAIQISGCTVIDNSRNVNAGIVTTTFLKNIIGADTPLGTCLEGGRLICKASSIGWIVAPSTSEVSRSWYQIDGANTRAQQVSGCTGWFIPTFSQLQNPGYTCRAFWDSYSSTFYWSSTAASSSNAFVVSFTGGTNDRVKTLTYCARAFRCVTY